MTKVDFSGFDEFGRVLKKLERNLKRKEGKNSVSFTELFPIGFMKRYTQFSSIEEMFNESPFTIHSEDDFAAVDDHEWENFIKSSTNFVSWEQMQEDAIVDWTRNQLGL